MVDNVINGSDRVEVGFTSTYAISVYRLALHEFDCRPQRSLLHAT
jgi:hypothetical protein